jgi:NAD(P)-dependent dehydrogenase (short-subunit alcohol dehydrogenase family)
MKSIKDQVILITGATDGLGKQVALNLARQGATLLLHGRSQARGEELLDEIQSTTGNKSLAYYRADFASLDEVRHLAEQILSDHDRLDVLVNNAGAGAGTHSDSRELSRDGYELRFAVNYLAPFLLTRQLLDLLVRSAPARIVNVASVGQEPIDFSNVMLERGYSGTRAYSQSKLAEIMLTFDLAEELGDRQVTANCLHPATLMPTKIVIESFGSGIASVEEGVTATVRLIADPGLDSTTGQYFNGTRPARANSQAYDAEARRRLRDLSEQLTGISHALKHR